MSEDIKLAPNPLWDAYERDRIRLGLPVPMTPKEEYEFSMEQLFGPNWRERVKEKK